jgi:RNA polymerase sigma factor (sigma-70 family)
MDFKQSDDLSLIQEIKADNILAFNELFRRYIRFLKVEAYYRLRDIQLSEEVVNDVFMYIWEKRDEIEIKISVKQYLFKSVTYTCVCRQRSMRIYCMLINSMDITETNSGFYPGIMENKELGQQIFAAISHISSSSSKRAFELQFIDNLSQKEIASEMNLSLNNVKKKVSRALQEVRKMLKKYQ